MIKKPKNKWFAHQTENKNALVNLVCFVFAGGSPSFFAPWKQLMPDWINLMPVLYPMREKRLKDSMPEDIETFVNEFFRDNKHLLDKKIVVWGHCSGSLIGMEYIRLLEENGVSPSAFIISGSEQPEYVLVRLRGDKGERPISELKDEDIIADLTKYQMMDTDMLENKVFCKYFIPLFKADLALFKGYVPEREPELSCPAVVMNGTDDKSLKWDSVEQWQEYFNTDVEFRTYPGAHYFVNDQKERIISEIADFIISNDSDIIPILPQQKKLVQSELIDKSRGCQNTGIAFEIKGRIDNEKLDCMLEELQKRHDAINYCLVKNSRGEIFQRRIPVFQKWIVHEAANEYPDFEEKRKAALRYAEAVNNEYMDLFSSPMYEFHKYIINDDHIILHIKASHIITDGPSISVLYKDMGDWFSNGAFMNDDVCSWHDFVIAENEYFSSEKGNADRTYWEEISCGWKKEQELSGLSFDKQNNEYEEKSEFTLELAAINSIARQKRMSPFNLMLFVYNAALIKIWGVNELSVGYTMTDRFSKGKRNMVGMTTHHLKHHLKKDGRPLSEHIEESRSQVNNSFSHYMLGECIGEAEFTLSYLSQIVLFPEWKGVDIEVHTMNGNQRYASLDYTLMCREEGDVLKMSMCADHDVYDLRFNSMLEKYMKEVLNELIS
ncbi:condensation domain-containing protein [Ruminococcus flavefaciens]|uniref:Surfactin synthase thioesterase subunit n=1 Tax=Ruminococcus flavefaciens TaxID=1265 RepID=A0A1M7K5A4_RUMFL|nr:condensation domain-containing protein [Ruminococcus flavefaciens]SHM60482.1 Surfactin synthase thioesterase subunit [Ruminococcus flavefaciens]